MEIKSVELKESTVDMDGRTIEGYASTWERDQTGDVIHQGAFARASMNGFVQGVSRCFGSTQSPLACRLKCARTTMVFSLRAVSAKHALAMRRLSLHAMALLMQ